jgi:uridine kinase
VGERFVVTALVSVSLLADAVRGASPRLGAVRLVAVDGPAGSGKTTLAAALAASLRAAGTDLAVFHLDDIYDGWAGLDGIGERFAAWILEPLAAGRAGRYRRYDWVAGEFAEWRDLPVPAVLIVDGCGAAQRSVDDVVSLRIWVEAPAALRIERGLARDGEAMRAEWERWMALEDKHFARELTRERADVRVDGTARLAP